MAPQTAFVSEERFTQKTFWDWLGDLPSSDINHYELLDGRIVMTPPAGWPHGSIEAAIVHRLSAFVLRRKLGLVLGSSTGYDLPSGDTVEPDASFISRQRLAAGPEPVAGRFLKVVPNLVVEIVSAATARRDRTEKKKIYEQNGVEEYWIVDPKQKLITVYSLGAKGHGAGKEVTSGAAASKRLVGLKIALKEIFRT